MLTPAKRHSTAQAATAAAESLLKALPPGWRASAEPCRLGREWPLGLPFFLRALRFQDSDPVLDECPNGAWCATFGRVEAIGNTPEDALALLAERIGFGNEDIVETLKEALPASALVTWGLLAQ